VDRYYLSLPKKYDRLGVEELVVVDPDHTLDPSRFLFQVFRRSKRGLICEEATNADRVKSKVLGCHLRAVGVADDVRVRLGTGGHGETLFPTDAERTTEAEAAAQEARTRRERAEATSRELAAQLEQVKAELALLRGGPKPTGPKRRASRQK
jgi:hypothetical protein